MKRVFTQAEQDEMEAVFRKLYGHHGKNTCPFTWPYYTDLARDIKQYFNHFMDPTNNLDDYFAALSFSIRITLKILKENDGCIGHQDCNCADNRSGWYVGCACMHCQFYRSHPKYKDISLPL